jgi:hypothetical protein
LFHRGDQREKFKKTIDSHGRDFEFFIWSPHETMKMSSSFERLQKIINKVYAKNLAIYFMWNTEIYQEPPTSGQDELYLPAMSAQPKKNVR